MNNKNFKKLLIEIRDSLGANIKTDATSHHYNPQFLLRRFRDEDSDPFYGDKSKIKIWQLNKGNGEVSKEFVKNVACSKDLYTIWDTKVSPPKPYRDFEAYFSRIENKAAIIWNNKIDKLSEGVSQRSHFSEKDATILAVFIAGCLVRTPSRREQIIEHSILFDWFKAFKESYEKKKGSIDAPLDKKIADPIISQLGQAYDNLNQHDRISRWFTQIGLGKNKQKSRHAMEDIAYHLVHRKWEVFVINPNQNTSRFITSDNVVGCNDKYLYGFPYINAHPEHALVVPLSKTKCLLISEADDLLSFTDAGKAMDVYPAEENCISSVNNNIYICSSDFVFGDSKQELIKIKNSNPNISSWIYQEMLPWGNYTVDLSKGGFEAFKSSFPTGVFI